MGPPVSRDASMTALVAICLWEAAASLEFVSVCVCGACVCACSGYSVVGARSSKKLASSKEC